MADGTSLNGVVGGFPIGWKACGFPERKPTAETVFDRGCAGCLVALRAAITVPPADGEFDGWWRSRDQILPILDDWMTP